VPLRRRGTGGIALFLPTAVAAVFALVALAGLVSPPTDGTDLFFVAVAAVPGVVALLLWRQHVAPAPRLALEPDALVVEDPLTLTEPLRVPWNQITAYAGNGLDGELATTLGHVGPFSVQRSAEHGLDVGPGGAPNLLLAFDPPVVPTRTRKVLTGRGARTIAPVQGMEIHRLWLHAADLAATVATFTAAGHPPAPAS
jgi:hypothetical protein